jgi:disulfide bond formation protein DsbB
MKPPFFLVLAFLGGTLLGIYNTYRLFTQPQKVKKESLKGISKLPKWYPLRAQMTKRASNANSPFELLGLILTTLVLLIVTILLFVSWVIGQ